MKIKINNIPQEMKDRDHWVVWKWETRNGKKTKPPYDPKTSRRASHSDSATWGTFEDPVKALDRGFDGIGFVFTEKDPLCGIDLDKCRDPASGEIATWALGIIQDFDSYSEISPSKTGLKIFIKGKLPGGGIKTKHVEIYDHLRYFTVTGERYGDLGDIKENQEALDRLVKKLRPPEKPKAKTTPQGGVVLMIIDSLTRCLNPKTVTRSSVCLMEIGTVTDHSQTRIWPFVTISHSGPGTVKGR